MSLDDFFVDIGELRRCVDTLLDRLESEASQLRMREDALWVVPRDALYDVYDYPQSMAVRSLSECWELAQRSAAGTPDLRGLVWLSHLLRYAGEDGPA